VNLGPAPIAAILFRVGAPEGRSPALPFHISSRAKTRRDRDESSEAACLRCPPREAWCRAWRSFEQVEFATLEWVDWFNNRRLLEPIGNIPPAEAEARYYAQLDEPAIAA
jgi:transposase InsO family protein